MAEVQRTQRLGIGGGGAGGTDPGEVGISGSGVHQGWVLIFMIWILQITIQQHPCYARRALPARPMASCTTQPRRRPSPTR